MNGSCLSDLTEIVMEDYRAKTTGFIASDTSGFPHWNNVLKGLKLP